MKFAREGIPFILVLGGATLVTNFAGWWWIGLVLLLFTLGTAAFFRDPDRQVPEGENLVLSPADGRVVAIDEDCFPESIPTERFRRIGIFMSITDVHVNRIPATGAVVSVRHTPGRFLAAFNKRAPIENERNEVVLRDSVGRALVFVQIAGLVARRIVCHLRPGQVVEQGSRFGLIMFGSRVDVYLPSPVRVRVRVGDKLHAGSDVLGEWS